MDTSTDVTYVIDGGNYAYRIDGVRLSDNEASDYLVQRKGYRPSAAFAAVKLARVDAAHSAELPEIRELRSGDFDLDQGRIRLRRAQLIALLTVEYRRTPAEAEQIADAAPAYSDY